MSADSDLQNAYHDWQRLAEAEGDAIRAGNWTRVSDSQSALEQLQPRISRCTELVREEWARLGLDRAEKEGAMRNIVKPLIELQRRNQALLDVHRRDAREKMGQLEEVGRTLLRIKRTYAPARPAAWTSFS